MIRIITTLAAALLALPALAAVEDTDGDGMYSLEEVQAAYPTVTEETFAEIDADGDGMLTEEDVAAAEEAGLLAEEG